MAFDCCCHPERWAAGLYALHCRATCCILAKFRSKTCKEFSWTHHQKPTFSTRGRRTPCVWRSHMLCIRTMCNTSLHSWNVEILQWCMCWFKFPIVVNWQIMLTCVNFNACFGVLIISDTHTDFVIGLAGHKAAASSVIGQATLTGLDHSRKCRKFLKTYFYIGKRRRRKVETKTVARCCLLYRP